MNKELLIDKYATLIVESGVNVQKGQPVDLRCTVESIELARKIAEKCYKRGASYVKINLKDNTLNKIGINGKSYEELNNIPDYVLEEYKYDQSRNICSISIVSHDPEASVGLDAKKDQTSRIAFAKKVGHDVIDYYSLNKGQWCVVGYPNKKWAKHVFPELEEDKAFEKLFEEILKTVRVNETNDPIEEWYKHNKTIASNCSKLNKYNFKELHYKNSLGTNLVVGLPVGHIWCGGEEKTNNKLKVPFNPNMPTEEVFTTPNRNNINGVIFASKPLVFAGNIIKDFWIKLVNGKITDYDAKVGKEYLKSIIETDDGSHYFGEVALVPYHSPISESKIIFYNTLFDENASCHFAIGNAYSTTVKNTDNKTEDELIKMGINSSFVHVDFMVGTSDLEIVGITYEGEQITIFKNGDFAI